MLVEPSLQVQSASSSLATAEPENMGQPWQTSDVAPTAIEYLAAGHLVHTADPVAILYVPATHLMHVPPSGPVDPAMQVQSDCASLASGAWEFDRHP